MCAKSKWFSLSVFSAETSIDVRDLYWYTGAVGWGHPNHWVICEVLFAEFLSALWRFWAFLGSLSLKKWPGNGWCFEGDSRLDLKGLKGMNPIFLPFSTYFGSTKMAEVVSISADCCVAVAGGLKYCCCWLSLETDEFPWWCCPTFLLDSKFPGTFVDTMMFLDEIWSSLNLGCFFRRQKKRSSLPSQPSFPWLSPGPWSLRVKGYSQAHSQRGRRAGKRWTGELSRHASVLLAIQSWGSSGLWPVFAETIGEAGHGPGPCVGSWHLEAIPGQWSIGAFKDMFCLSNCSDMQ